MDWSQIPDIRKFIQLVCLAIQATDGPVEVSTRLRTGSPRFLRVAVHNHTELRREAKGVLADLGNALAEGDTDLVALHRTELVDSLAYYVGQTVKECYDELDPPQFDPELGSRWSDEHLARAVDYQTGAAAYMRLLARG